MKRDKIHLYDLDSGAVVCRGIDLAEAARPLDEDPLKITIYVEEATCWTCKRRWELLQKTRVVA